jgi:hypothetical protein
LMSKPTTGYLLAKATARGNPTYPNPMMATRILSLVLKFASPFPLLSGDALLQKDLDHNILGYKTTFFILNLKAPRFGDNSDPVMAIVSAGCSV